MSLQTNYDREFGNTYTIECDGTHCMASEEADEFEDVISQIKNEGWLLVRYGSEWQHYCPSCRANKPVESTAGQWAKGHGPDDRKP